MMCDYCPMCSSYSNLNDFCRQYIYISLLSASPNLDWCCYHTHGAINFMFGKCCAVFHCLPINLASLIAFVSFRLIQCWYVVIVFFVCFCFTGYLYAFRCNGTSTYLQKEWWTGSGTNKWSKTKTQGTAAAGILNNSQSAGRTQRARQHMWRKWTEDISGWVLSSVWSRIQPRVMACPFPP